MKMPVIYRRVITGVSVHYSLDVMIKTNTAVGYQKKSLGIIQ